MSIWRVLRKRTAALLPPAQAGHARLAPQCIWLDVVTVGSQVHDRLAVGREEGGGKDLEEGRAVVMWW